MTNEKIPDEAYVQAASRTTAQIALMYSVPSMRMTQSVPVSEESIVPYGIPQYFQDELQCTHCQKETSHLRSLIQIADQYMLDHFGSKKMEQSMGYIQKDR